LPALANAAALDDDVDLPASNGCAALAFDMAIAGVHDRVP
jgi:hypothetical protein